MLVSLGIFLGTQTVGEDDKIVRELGDLGVRRPNGRGQCPGKEQTTERPNAVHGRPPFVSCSQEELLQALDG